MRETAEHLLEHLNEDKGGIYNSGWKLVVYCLNEDIKEGVKIHFDSFIEWTDFVAANTLFSIAENNLPRND